MLTRPSEIKNRDKNTMKILKMKTFLIPLKEIETINTNKEIINIKKL